MTKIPMALISADEFEIARRFIPEFSSYQDYDDWLDYQYGRFMGWSLGGLDTELISIALEDFLNWCRSNQFSPSEQALDDFSRQIESRAKHVYLAA